jgi:hypothetical protein
LGFGDLSRSPISRLRFAKAEETAKNHFFWSPAHSVRLRSSARSSRFGKASVHSSKCFLVSRITPLSKTIAPLGAVSSFLVAAIASSFVALLFLRPLAAALLLLDTSAQCASSASMRLCFHPAWKNGSMIDRIFFQSRSAMHVMRASCLSSSGRPPDRQYSMMSRR